MVYERVFLFGNIHNRAGWVITRNMYIEQEQGAPIIKSLVSKLEYSVVCSYLGTN